MIAMSSLYRHFDRDPLTAEAVLRYFTQHDQLNTPLVDAYITYIEKTDPDFRGRLLMHLVDAPFDDTHLERLMALHGQADHYDAYLQTLLSLTEAWRLEKLREKGQVPPTLEAMIERKKEVEETPLDALLAGFVRLAASPEKSSENKRRLSEYLAVLEMRKEEVAPWLHRQLAFTEKEGKRLPIHEVFLEMAPRYGLDHHLPYVFEHFDEEPAFFARILGLAHDERIQTYLKTTLGIASGEGLFFRLLLAAAYRDLEGRVFQGARHRLTKDKQEAVYLELLRNFHSGAYQALMVLWQEEIPTELIPLVIPYLSLTESDEDLRARLIVKQLERGRARKKWLEGVERQAKEKVGPNAPCPCGSGKKYKKCCSNRLELGS